MSLFGCCYGENKQIIYVVGSKENKDLFFRNVLNAEPTSEHFLEIERSFGAKSVIIQSTHLGVGVPEINSLHKKIACGLVYISDKDEAIDSTKKTLFVLMNKKSKQESDDRFIVASVVNGSYTECKSGFTKLVDLISQ